MNTKKDSDPSEWWCDPTCPRQQTHMWSNCDCGGARREFEYYREQHERAQRP